MPRDKRLYMTFPNNFWRHAKIAPLSDNAFRTFVEMNGYSRDEKLDGRIPVAFARLQWKPKSLDELQQNHPTRPTLTVERDDSEGDVYVIRNYGEHQPTNADIEAQSATNSENGKLGGRPPKRKRSETESVTDPKANLKHSQSQESESDIEPSDISQLSESSHLRDAPDSGPEISDLVAAQAEQAGIRDLPAVMSLLVKECGPIAPDGAVVLVNAITARAKGNVRDVDAYVATACRNTPDEIRWDYDRLDLAVAS